MYYALDDDHVPELLATASAHSGERNDERQERLA
jgi:hypothetical protein